MRIRLVNIALVLTERIRIAINADVRVNMTAAALRCSGTAYYRKSAEFLYFCL
jgi:hypothetical protein